MFSLRQTRSILWGLLAVVMTYAMVDTADAQTRRLRFDPDYGTPFGDLYWKGYADVSYGSCDGPGWVTNLPSSCNGALTFTGGQVQLYNANTDALLQAHTFTSGDLGNVLTMNFDASSQLTQVHSSPFTPFQGGDFAEVKQGGSSAYFSLVFVGEYAQLMWFKVDPGRLETDPLNLFTAGAYAGCYFFGQNGALANAHWSGKCGISSNLESQGARFEVTAVPEAEAYMLALAGLGVLGVTGSISRRRKAKG